MEPISPINAFRYFDTYARYYKRLEIDAVVGERVIQSDTRDISAGGMFVNTNANLEPRRTARVVFSIPGYDRPFKLHSKVVRTEDEGVATPMAKEQKCL